MSLKSDLLKQARFGGRLLVWGPPVVHEDLIKKLFANGEQGVWYDPSDISTLFQDAAGTIPVTSDGDPVGLMLDKSQGLELGPELVDASSWSSADSSFVINGDTVEKTGSSGDLFVFTDQGVVGSFVEITVEFENLRDGVPVIVTNGQTNTDYPNFATAGYIGSFTLTTRQKVTSNLIGIYGTNARWKLLSVSVRELPGNHATQSVSASRPTYRTDGTLHWLETDGADDYMNTSDPLSYTSHTLFAAFLSGSGGRVIDNRGTGALGTKTGYFVRSDALGIDSGDGEGVNVFVATPDVKEIWTLPYDENNKTLVLRQNGTQTVSEQNNLLGSIVTTLNFRLFASANDASQRMRGEFYGTIVREGVVSDDDIVRTEQYLAGKTGVTL